MNTAVSNERPMRAGTGALPAESDVRLAVAVRDAYATPCPAAVALRIRAEVQAEESAVRAWQAKWLFAVPAIQVGVLIALRSDVASMAATVGRVLEAAREDALPNWQGCQALAQSCWQFTGTVTGAEPVLPADLIPWALAGLVAATLSAIVILRQEASHA